MLRTNLSTRPFYNIRAVQVTLGALALLVVVLTLLNLVQLIRLTSSGRALGARAAQAEADAQRLRDEARRIRSQIDAKELNEVAAAAEEANAIIDLRAFSWSELFSQLETTEPENVRLTSFQTAGRSNGQVDRESARAGATGAGPRVFYRRAREDGPVPRSARRGGANHSRGADQRAR